MRLFYLFSDYPVIWEVFQTVCFMSSTDANGMLTVSSLGTYLDHTDVKVSCTAQEFFSVIGTMLERENSHILKRRKGKGKK